MTTYDCFLFPAIRIHRRSACLACKDIPLDVRHNKPFVAFDDRERIMELTTFQCLGQRLAWKLVIAFCIITGKIAKI